MLRSAPRAGPGLAIRPVTLGDLSTTSRNWWVWAPVELRSRRWRSTLNTNIITGLDMCQGYVPKQSIANTLKANVITGLDMCQVCTEAGHCVALWTRTLSQFWTCVEYVPTQASALHFEHEPYITGLDMCQVCTEAVHCVALWTWTLSQVWTCTETGDCLALWTRT